MYVILLSCFVGTHSTVTNFPNFMDPRPRSKYPEKFLYILKMYILPCINIDNLQYVFQEPSHSKRPHIVTEKMQEFIKTQGDISPNKQRSCPVEGCNKVLTSAPGLRYHIQTHHKDVREFTCSGCKKVFKRFVFGYVSKDNSS